MSIAAVVLSCFLLPGRQSDPSALVEKLRSESLLEREEAVARLKALGPAAARALEKVEFDPDPEVALRAKSLLAVYRFGLRLSPSTLSAFPSAPEDLASSQPDAWARVFLKVARRTDASRADLTYLAPRALSMASTPELKAEILEGMTTHRVRSAVPLAVEFVLQADDYWGSRAMNYLKAIDAQDQLPAVIRAAGEGSPRARAGAARLLGMFGGDPELPLLRKLLKDSDPAVRAAAAEALQEREAKVGLDDVKDLLEDPATQGEGLDYLQMFGISEGAPKVENALRTGTEEVRRSAARAAGRLRMTEAVPDLLSALKNGGRALQEEAASALAGIGHTEAFTPILEILQSHPELLQSSVPAHLVRLDDNRAGEILPAYLVQGPTTDHIVGALRTLMPGKPRPQLLRLLFHQDPAVRTSAFEVVSHIIPSDCRLDLEQVARSSDPAMALKAVALLRVAGTRESIATLRAVLNSRPTREILVGAMQSLAALGATEAVPDLKGLLDHLDAAVRSGALWALFSLDAWEIIDERLERMAKGSPEDRLDVARILYQLKGVSAVPDLRRFLIEDPNLEVRSTAFILLGSLGPTHLQREAPRYLSDPDDRVRSLALYHTSLSPLPSTAPMLRRLAQEGSKSTRMLAIDGLSRLADLESVPQWMSWLSDAEENIRRAAARALARAGGPDEARAIAALVSSPDPETRMGALATLALLRYPEADGAVLRAVEDPNVEVREEAVRTLEALRLPGGRKAFAQASRDRSESVRLRAVGALAHPWGPDAIPVLKERLRDPDRLVRLNSAESLVSHGEKAGVPTLLEESGPLVLLNALRSPRMWERLSAMPAPDPPDLMRDMGRRVASSAGLKYEPRDTPSKSLTGRISSWAVPKTAVEALSIGLGRDSWIVEEDRLRVVSSSEALVFWKAWLAAER